MKSKKNNPEKTVLVITLGFMLMFIVTDIKWLLFVALAVGVLGAMSSYLSEKIDYLWMKLAWILSLIVPKIILGAIFYFFLFPIALLSKLFGNKDPLQLKNQSGSIFKTVDKDFDKTSFERMY